MIEGTNGGARWRLGGLGALAAVAVACAAGAPAGGPALPSGPPAPGATGGPGGGTAPAVEPEGFIAPSEACDADADCVATDFAGCCACCQCVTPYAMRADALAAEQDRCAVVDCSFEGCDEECRACPIAPLGTARCDRGRCVVGAP